MPYRIEIKISASKEIAALPKRQQHRIATAITALADKPRPRGVRKLLGTEDYYRIRVGDYRIIYQAVDKVLIVYVIRVAHRKDVYRRL